MLDWSEFRLGNHCLKIGSGATPRGGGDTYLPSGQFSLIRSQNVLDFRFSNDGLAYISEEQADKLQNVEVRDRDILLNITGDSVARVCQVSKSILPARVNQHVAIIRPNPQKIHPEFLKYYLLQPSFKSHMMMLASSGATRNALTKGMIESFSIKAPDLPTQTAIAEILSSLDDKIELNHQINQNLEALAEAIFKRWFIDFEFPDENGQPYKSSGGKMVESELGKIPKDWKIYSMSDLVDSVSTTYKLQNVAKVVFLNTGDILNGEFLHNTFSDTSTLPGQAKKSIQKGDILYSEIRPENKRFAYVHFEATQYVVSTKLMVLRSKVNVNPLFQYFLLTRVDTIQHLQRLAEARSGTFPQITYSELSTIKVPLPEIDKVGMFVETVILPIYNLKFHSTAENASLRNLRSNILPKLISGELQLQTVQKKLQEV